MKMLYQIFTITFLPDTPVEPNVTVKNQSLMHFSLPTVILIPIIAAVDSRGDGIGAELAISADF